MNEVTNSNLERTARLAVRTDSLLGIDLVLIGSPADSVSTPSSRSPSSDQASEYVYEAPVNTQGTTPAPTAIAIDDSYFDEQIDQASRLSKLESHHAEACGFCAPNAREHPAVFGEGAHDASLMFVGEAPGTEEERLGRPFVGRAGAKLDEMIKAMGLCREDVYITNALKSRPSDSRAIGLNDFALCGIFLAAQVRIIQPKVIVALGGPASKLLLKTELGITSLRGQWSTYDDGSKKVAIMPTFHPAYLLRNPTLEVRGQIWTDLQEVMKALGLPAPGEKQAS